MFKQLIDWRVSNSTPSSIVVVPNFATALDEFDKAVGFALDCAQNCLTAPYKLALDKLIDHVLVSSGKIPSLPSEPVRYQIMKPTGGLVLDVVVVAVAIGVGATLPETLFAIGATAFVYKVLEVVVRPFPVN